MRYGPTWLVFAAIAMLAPRAVQAQAAPELSSSSRFWGGGSFAVAPVGTHRWTRDGKPESSAFNTTYSLGALFDVRALPFVSIGVAPSVNFDFQDRETLLELPVRFPNISTVQTQLREPDVAALAHYTSWMIGQNQDALRELFRN